MQFHKPTSEIWIPDGLPVAEGLVRCTHAVIGAHQDDIEIMAMEPVLHCYGNAKEWVLGVVVTDGSSSARQGPYATYTNEEMMAVRRMEQKKAAFVGEYGAVVFLDYTSAEIKDPSNLHPVEDIQSFLNASATREVFTHNLADKHPTHIGVTCRTLQALSGMEANRKPNRVLGCEVWRDLDWMLDSDKVVMRLDDRDNLQMALVGIFDSQVAGGKRYDLATMGRRRAHATYHESHAVDASQLINFAMDLTPLIGDNPPDMEAYVVAHIDRFAGSVKETLRGIRA